MPNKPVAKKKSITKRGAPSHGTNIGTMTGGVIANKINVKGNWIEKQYNDYRQQIAQIATPQQFIAEAEKLQAQIAQIKQLPALPPAQVPLVQAAETNVQTAAAEAKKDKPNPKTMSDTLKTAAETMTGVGKAVEAAQDVAGKVTQAVDRVDWPRLVVGATALADLAARIFGAIPK